MGQKFNIRLDIVEKLEKKLIPTLNDSRALIEFSMNTPYREMHKGAEYS